MKTFVILSDTHGRRRNVEKVLPILAENDCIVHLGDGSGDLREFSRTHPEKDVIVLKGNCDFSYGMEEYVIEAEGVRMLCCHGHKYGVKSGLARLAARAKEQDCTVALYGHTHRAAASDHGDVLDGDGFVRAATARQGYEACQAEKNSDDFFHDTLLKATRIG